MGKKRFYYELRTKDVNNIKYYWKLELSKFSESNLVGGADESSGLVLSTSDGCLYVGEYDVHKEGYKPQNAEITVLELKEAINRVNMAPENNLITYDGELSFDMFKKVGKVNE